MRMGQGVRTGLGHGGIICVLQTQFSIFFFFWWGGGGKWLYEVRTNNHYIVTLSVGIFPWGRWGDHSLTVTSDQQSSPVSVFTMQLILFSWI